MTSAKSIDPASIEMLEVAGQSGLSTAFSRADEVKPCPIGRGGACCKNCNMGPCRLTGKNAEEEMHGVCGATLSTIAAHYRVTVKAIQDANKIADRSLIVPGQKLVIPWPR